jgi:enoyl-CoA hydratase/carnithine racemase
MTDLVQTQITDGILTITFNRPERKNALSNVMYDKIADAMLAADADPAVRVILFEANGESFTAGNDIAEFAAVATGAASRADMKAFRLLDALATATKPIVAAVQGNAVGVGCTMLFHCDLVYVAEDAKLSTPFVGLALVPEAASSVLIPARIGHVRAFSMFALGEVIEGQEAVAIGIANKVVARDALSSVARAAALALSDKPLTAVMATKKLMRDPESLRAVMKTEGAIFSTQLQTDDAREAFMAFAERRKPNFRQFN